MALKTIKYASGSLGILRNPLIDFFWPVTPKHDELDAIIPQLTLAEIDAFGQRLSTASPIQIRPVINKLPEIAANSSFRHQYLAVAIVRHCPMQAQYVPQILDAAKVSPDILKEVSRPVSWFSRILNRITGRPPQKQWLSSAQISQLQPKVTKPLITRPWYAFWLDNEPAKSAASFHTPARRQVLAKNSATASPSPASSSLSLKTPSRKQASEQDFKTPSPSHSDSPSVSSVSYVERSRSSSPAGVSPPSSRKRKRPEVTSPEIQLDDRAAAALERIVQRRRLEMIKAAQSASPRSPQSYHSEPNVFSRGSRAAQGQAVTVPSLLSSPPSP